VRRWATILAMATAMCGCVSRKPEVIHMRPPRVAVGDTAEGHACERQCMQITASCPTGCSANMGFNADAARAAVTE
jgi:hypothetical protein